MSQRQKFIIIIVGIVLLAWLALYLAARAGVAVPFFAATGPEAACAPYPRTKPARDPSKDFEGVAGKLINNTSFKQDNKTIRILNVSDQCYKQYVKPFIGKDVLLYGRAGKVGGKSGVILQEVKLAGEPTTNPTPVAEASYVGLTHIPFGRATIRDLVVLDQRTGQAAKTATNFWNNNFSPIGQFPGANKFKLAHWPGYIVQKKLKVSKNSIAGLRKAALADSYFISDVFQTTARDATSWKMLNLHYKTPATANIQLYYRVANDDGIEDPNAPDWIPITINEAGTKRVIIQKNQIDRLGRSLQFKIHLDNPQAVVSNIALLAQTGGVVTPVSPSPSPGVVVSPSPVAATTGQLTLLTKKLPLNVPSPSPSPDGPALPDQAATVPPAINPDCFASEAEPVPDVRVNLRQTAGGHTRIDDELTDDEGVWHGKGGNVDDFPTGTYTVTFGEFQKNDYQLVALCVSPDDGLHHVKTQTTPSNRQATIIVLPNQETKVTALYAPRTRPFISMNVFALEEDPADTNSSRRILRRIFPGQKLFYFIRYENTGADAKEVVIRNVLTDQLELPEEVVEDAEEKYGFLVSTDSKGRTMITKTVGEVKSKEKGSFTIPVLVRSSGFSQAEASFTSGSGSGQSLQ